MLSCSAQIYWDQFVTIAGKQKRERERRTCLLGTPAGDPVSDTETDHSYHSRRLYTCTDHFETGYRSQSAAEIPWNTL